MPDAELKRLVRRTRCHQRGRRPAATTSATTSSSRSARACSRRRRSTSRPGTRRSPTVGSCSSRRSSVRSGTPASPTASRRLRRLHDAARCSRTVSAPELIRQIPMPDEIRTAARPRAPARDLRPGRRLGLHHKTTGEWLFADYPRRTTRSRSPARRVPPRAPATTPGTTRRRSPALQHRRRSAALSRLRLPREGRATARRPPRRSSSARSWRCRAVHRCDPVDLAEPLDLDAEQAAQPPVDADATDPAGCSARTRSTATLSSPTRPGVDSSRWRSTSSPAARQRPRQHPVESG